MNLAYAPRRIHCLEISQQQDWQLKVYSILHDSKTLDSSLIESAKHAANNFLPQPAHNPNRYGLGFISVHQGQSYDFVTVAFWNYETELKHQTYMRPSSTSNKLEPLTASELSSDVWDLSLLAFERDAWLETVLSKDEADFEAYLAKQLDETM